MGDDLNSTKLLGCTVGEFYYPDTLREIAPFFPQGYGGEVGCLLRFDEANLAYLAAHFQKRVVKGNPNVTLLEPGLRLHMADMIPLINAGGFGVGIHSSAGVNVFASRESEDEENAGTLNANIIDEFAVGVANNAFIGFRLTQDSRVFGSEPTAPSFSISTGIFLTWLWNEHKSQSQRIKEAKAEQNLRKTEVENLEDQAANILTLKEAIKKIEQGGAISEAVERFAQLDGLVKRGFLEPLLQTEFAAAEQAGDTARRDRLTLLADRLMNPQKQIPIREALQDKELGPVLKELLAKIDRTQLSVETDKLIADLQRQWGITYQETGHRLEKAEKEIDSLKEGKNPYLFDILNMGVRTFLNYRLVDELEGAVEVPDAEIKAKTFLAAGTTIYTAPTGLSHRRMIQNAPRPWAIAFEASSAAVGGAFLAFGLMRENKIGLIAGGANWLGLTLSGLPYAILGTGKKSSGPAEQAGEKEALDPDLLRLGIDAAIFLGALSFNLYSFAETDDAATSYTAAGLTTGFGTAAVFNLFSGEF